MCRVDDAEPVEVCNTIIRKARKQHECFECRRPIESGDRYEYATFLFDGRWSQHRTCFPCMTLRSWLDRECSGWVLGEVIEEIEEHWRDANWGDRDNSNYFDSFLGWLVLMTRSRLGRSHATETAGS